MTEWIKVGVTIVLIIVVSTAQGQSRKELEAKRKEIIDLIEATSSSLELTSKNKKATLSDLKAIEMQIANRQKLIATIAAQLRQADASLANNKRYLDSLSVRLVQISDDYNDLLRYAYLRELATQKWTYILSADGLNEAFLRWRYTQQYKDYLQRKTTEERSIRTRITQRNQDITKEREYITQLLEDEKRNKLKLENDQKKKDQILEQLKGEEDNLRSQLAQQKKDREKLNQEIERIILAELSKKKNTASATSGALAKNSLAWPVSGYVSGRFGNQPHPTLPNVQISNNGIDVTSTSGSAVRAVAAGTVISITNIPGYDNMVIVQHGDYYSVYSKLASVSVSNLENITSGTVIGTLANESAPVLHFEWWKGKEKLNPENWLK